MFELYLDSKIYFKNFIIVLSEYVILGNYLIVVPPTLKI